MTSLETTIARMTGQRLTQPAMTYRQPDQVPTYQICPFCQRIPLFHADSQQWECAKCGAVCNEWPYRAEEPCHV